jgi:hypothetical protein
LKDWKPCSADSALLCATLQVPLDYNSIDKASYDTRYFVRYLIVNPIKNCKKCQMPVASTLVKSLGQVYEQILMVHKLCFSA